MEALSPNQWTPGEFSTFNFLRNLYTLKIMEGLKEVFFVCVYGLYLIKAVYLEEIKTNILSIYLFTHLKLISSGLPWSSTG